MVAKFIKSAIKVQDYFVDKRDQVCFVGRSNVGKSSLINALANNAKLSKVSKTPGRTRLVNFFDFEKFVLVDLPGYGYANADLKTREQIYDLIIECLNYNTKLVAVFQLCNIDVITQDDQKMSYFLQQSKFEHFILLTKADRVNKSHFNNNKTKIAKYLNVDENKLIDVSVKNKHNIDKVLKILKLITN